MKPTILSPHLLANVFVRGGHPVLGLIAVLIVYLPALVMAVAALLKAIG